MRTDLPLKDQESEPWWDALADEQLLIRRCGACGDAHLYPRLHCPTCWSEDLTWEVASGRARLHTWSVVHRNDLPPFRDRVPYVAAIVELEEGPRLATNVVDADHDALRMDQELEVVFHRDDEAELTVPHFRPATNQEP